MGITVEYAANPKKSGGGGGIAGAAVALTGTAGQTQPQCAVVVGGSGGATLSGNDPSKSNAHGDVGRLAISMDAVLKGFYSAGVLPMAPQETASLLVSGL